MLKENSKLVNALYKKAVGFDTKEVTEEYQEKDGDIILVKRKVTKKSVPPDITALKIIMEQEGSKVSSMTDEELEEEKQRLLTLLQKGDENDIKRGV